MKKTIDALDRNDIAEYRLNVHRECYLIGSRLLSPDGVINFIDRCSISDPDHMDDAIKSFSEQHEKLSEYSFKTINAKFKLLSEFFETSALQYSAQSAVPKVNPILSSVVLKRQG